MTTHRVLLLSGAGLVVLLGLLVSRFIPTEPAAWIAARAQMATSTTESGDQADTPPASPFPAPAAAPDADAAPASADETAAETPAGAGSTDAVPEIPARPVDADGAPVVVRDDEGAQVETVAPGAAVEALDPGADVQAMPGTGLRREPDSGGDGGAVRVERLGGTDLAPIPEGATAPVRVTEDQRVNDPVRAQVRDPTRFYRGVDTVPFWDEIRVGDRTGALEVLERMRADNPGWSPSPSMVEALAVDTTPFWARIEAGDRAGANAVMQQLRRDNPDWYPTSNMIEALTTVDTRPFWARMEAGDRAGAREILAQLRAENPDWVPDRRMMEALATVDTRPFWDRIQAGDRPGAREALRDLRREYPDWTPTPDMLEALQVDTRPFWAEVRTGDLDGARAMIETLRTANPDWQPSEAMTEALNLMRLSALAEAGRHGEIVALAGSEPDLFACDRIEALWWLADAHAALRQKQALSALYRRILTQCPAPSPEDLGITLQKASTHLPTEEFAAYVKAIDAAGWPTEARTRYDQATQGLASRRLQEAIESGNVTAVERAVADTPAVQRDPALTNLVGYFLLNKRRPADARPWFERSLALEETFDARQGLVLALVRSNALDRAAEVAGAAPEKRAALQRIVGDAYADAATRAARRGQRAEARTLTEKAAALGVRRPGPSAVGIGYERLNKGDPQGALARFVASYKRNPTPASATGITVALQQLGRVAEARQMACGWSARAANLAQLCQDLRASEAALAFEAGDYDQVLAMAAEAGPGANADLRALEAWSYYSLEEYDRAEAAFEAALQRSPGNTDMLEGLALTRLNGGRPGEAMDLACPRAGSSAGLADACADAAATLANESFEDGDWRAVLRTAEIARASGADNANLAQLEGWSLLRLDRPEEASQRFEVAYRADPDSGAGAGLLESLEKSGDTRRARYLVEDLGGPLKDAWRVRAYDTYVERSQYLMAHQALGDEEPALRGLFDPEVVMGVFYRSRSGDDGLDAFTGRYGQLEMGDAFTGFNGYPARWGLRVEGLDADIGDPDACALVGRRGQINDQSLDATANFLATLLADPNISDSDREIVNQAIADVRATRARGSNGAAVAQAISDACNRVNASLPSAVQGAWVASPTSGDSIFHVYADFRQEAPNSTFEGSVGFGPVGGEVGAVPLGHLSVTSYGDGATLSGTAFAETRKDSLLSQSGMVDPFTGDSWGRVVEYGLKAGATFDVSERFAVSAEVLGSYLTGRDVEDNRRLRGTLSAAYDLKPDGFKYLRVGPSLMVQGYDKNLSKFTYGHGGYYSPQWNTTAGLFVDLLTLEGKDWLVGGRAFAGLTSSEEDSTPLFPTEDDGQRYAGTDSEGLSTELELRGAWQVAPQWQLGGLLRHSTAPDYEDTAVGMTLRYSFGERGGVLARDLPSFVDRGRQ
ncbi:cellulose synthase subunit BcsC-related outer membrane protein [Roseospira visakhapatnamensis]|uniref:Tetratricopeptide (TPR) repeat protein n=1 Tax=Roseospira visakhapatnamensis TaxID=390880 RepID=A0A7W6RBT6_9PROT|nr:cellulose synthase subunit BcsC-related outer membrane protein [Roseospira visakhapatnamensis]MBB4265079.1 tetratricopeptide (TPR) repeat protein [Roseospira visakhapatnamensis]